MNYKLKADPIYPKEFSKHYELPSHLHILFLYNESVYFE